VDCRKNTFKAGVLLLKGKYENWLDSLFCMLTEWIMTFWDEAGFPWDQSNNHLPPCPVQFSSIKSAFLSTD
jgi:hypothetical protein